MSSSIYKPTKGEGYVYMFTNPLKNNDPFYVGVCLPGTKKPGRRPYEHFKPSQLKSNTYKNNSIKKIAASGQSVGICIGWRGADTALAFWYERFFVALYGTYYDGTGTLTNLTKGGEGVVGHVYSEEQKEAARQRTLAFYQTEKGKRIRLENGVRMKDWFKTEDGLAHIQIILKAFDASRDKTSQKQRDSMKTEKGRERMRKLCASHQTPQARANNSRARKHAATTPEGKQHLLNAAHSRTPEIFATIAGKKRKLTPEQAEDVRIQMDNGVSRKVLADKYSVGVETISHVRHHKNGY